MQINIEDCEVKVKCIIGGDCTFTHLEKHEIIKGYLEYNESKKESEEDNGRKDNDI